MGVFRRLFQGLQETDEARHAAEIQMWAESIPGSVRIEAAPSRDRVKIAGMVRRMTVFPMQGQESLEALLSDGTGEISVVFMGRRSIPGFTLGSRIVVEGVIGEQHGVRRMLNPKLELSS